MNPSKKPKWGIILAAVVIVSVVAGLGVITWRESVTKVQAQRAKVEQLIAEGRVAEALAMIQQRNRAVKKQSEPVRQEWLALEIAALEQTGDGQRLLALHEESPAAFQSREAACLLVARAFLRKGDFEQFDKLRAEWRGRESSPAGWFEIEVDGLLLRGQRDAAVQLLNSRSFDGPADSGRLARLAMTHLPGDFKTASHYLDQAVAANPHNAEVHLQRGRLLEGSSKLSSARMEYTAAFLANTNNPFFRDQLAEFYRRTGNYDLALRTWAGGLNPFTATDGMWLRAAFWSKVARPLPFDLTGAEPAPGPVQPLVRYLLRLRPGTFWDAAAFAKLPGAAQYEEHLQETFWLRLLDALQAGRETDALKIIETNRFRSRSWHLDLESALLRVLGYRQTGELKFPDGVTIALNEAPPKTRHQLLELLDAHTREPGQKLPADTEQLLRSPKPFAAIVLAAGWPEAALQLPHPDVIPGGVPEWVAYAFTQALRLNRGNDAALEFAARQKQSPPLELLTADILIAAGRFNEGVLKLTPLADTDSESGARAARMIADTYLRLKLYDEARHAVEQQPRLAKSPAGQELLARIALGRGDRATAENIYAALETESDEAKQFLVQQAVEQKNWPRARQLTEALIHKHPEQVQYRAMLEAIAKAEAGK